MIDLSGLGVALLTVGGLLAFIVWLVWMSERGLDAALEAGWEEDDLMWLLIMDEEFG